MPQLHDEGVGVKERLTSSDRDRPDAPGTQPGPCVSISTNRAHLLELVSPARATC